MQTIPSIQRVKNHVSVIESLRIEAKKNPAFEAVCYWFAMRDRTRSQITLRTLTMVMAEAGFKHTQEEYAAVLTFLASLGIGTLDQTGGKLRALKDIRITLQSVGFSALEKDDKQAVLKSYKQSRKFLRLESKAEENQSQEPKTVTPAPRKPTQITVQEPKAGVKLVITIGGQAVEFPLPTQVSPENIGGLITEFLAFSDKGVSK